MNDLILNVLFLPFIISAVANNLSINKLIFGCGIMIVARIFIELFNSWKDSVYIPKSNSDIEYGFQLLLYDKIEAIDLIKYDDPEFYNSSVWAAKDINNRAVEVLNTFFNWLGDLLMIGSIISIIIAFEPILLICSIFPCILALLFNNKINATVYQLDKDNILPDRQMSYINKLFTSASAAKEFRLFPSINNPLMSLYNKAIKNKQENTIKYGNKVAYLISTLSITTIFFSHVIAMIYLAYKAIVIQNIDAGVVITLTNSIWQISARVDSLFGIVNQMKKHSMYINNFKNIVTMKSDICKNENGKLASLQANTIKLEQVSYQYPNQKEWVLKDINMEIKKGQKIAIVGCNGAGKTTLIKLIMRLYLPSTGKIYFDNEPEENYNLKSLRSRFGVLFQDFQLYAVSVLDNVIMSQSNGSEEERKQVNQALVRSGLYSRIYKEKNNLQTSIHKDFDEDGLILSGGEAQKLAAARVFAKDSGIIIMDEPSSALDPFSEYELHNSVLEAAKDKTVILISHRLSTTKNADKIFYIECGKIAEAGSHGELMKLDGLYAKMFKIQAEKYNLNRD